MLKLNEATINGLGVHFVEFSDSRIIIQTAIKGTIINSIVDSSSKEKLLSWKKQISNHVYNERQQREDPTKQFIVSISMRFCPLCHGKNKLDVENYLKPILDGIAKGLFCDIDSLTTPKFNFDDSNFAHLFIERLPDAIKTEDELIIVTVSCRYFLDYV